MTQNAEEHRWGMPLLLLKCPGLCALKDAETNPQWHLLLCLVFSGGMLIPEHANSGNALLPVWQDAAYFPW